MHYTKYSAPFWASKKTFTSLALKITDLKMYGVNLT